MKKKVQGISLILFGILLECFALFNPVIPIIDLYVAQFSNFAGILVGVVGLIMVFKSDKTA